MFRKRAAPPLTAETPASQLVQLYQIARRFLLDRGLWSLLEASTHERTFRFRGFAIPPRDSTMPLRFFVNDSEAPVLDHPRDPYIDALAGRFGLRPARESYSFACAVPLVSGSDTVHIEFRPGSGVQLFPYHDWYVRLQPGVQPETWRRVRVARTNDPVLFASMGLSACAALRCALRQYFQRDFDQCEAILDWGCGCARVARWVAELASDHVAGIDIDQDNISWCSENIRGAQFQAIPCNPPTPFPPQRFDLIYGISVLTHLSETDQDRWLEELHRLAKPGAAVLISIHGEVAFCRGDSDFQRFLGLERNGFFVHSRNPDLDEVLPEMKETSYYKNVFHSRDYVFENWSRYFEVLDVLEGALNAYQDLVVMRRGA